MKKAAPQRPQAFYISTSRNLAANSRTLAVYAAGFSLPRSRQWGQQPRSHK